MAHAGALSLSLIFAALATASAQADRNYGKLPLAFELNVGQTDSQALFLTRGHGMTTFFTESGAIMTLDNGERQAAVRMNLAAARPARAVGLEKLPGVTNYFIGNDPKKWRTNVPNYARIRYQDVYPGVDLVWYGNQRQLEYDFVVAPGADPDQIQVAYDGVESLRVDGGDLVLRTALGDVRQKRPRVYQDIGGRRVEVAARYTLRARRRVSFELARYDRTRELRIDPLVLVYWTPVTGAGDDYATGIAVDAAGSAYITGRTTSATFPTQSPYRATLPGAAAAFVAKLTPAGDALVYSTYLGGTASAREPGHSITHASGIGIDATGAAYVAGYTDSTDFPTISAHQASHHGDYDAFVTKLSPTGNALLYSTFLGGAGADQAFGIAVTGAGAAYVVGATYSEDFPRRSAYQSYRGRVDAFTSNLSAAGALLYSTYLGGTGDDYGYAIAVDAQGSAYVTGFTSSQSSFPTVSPFQASNRSAVRTCFVTKLSPGGGALAYSTFLGGTSYDMGRAIAVDQTGSAYIAGLTWSSDFPTQSAYRPSPPVPQHSWTEPSSFVTKLVPSGSALVYSTYLGSSLLPSYINHAYDGFDAPVLAIAVDAQGSAYITGATDSTAFPLQSPIQGALQGQTDAYLTVLAPAGDALLFSTYLGGTRADFGGGLALHDVGSVYIAGWTADGADINMSPSHADAFVTKLGLRTTVTIATNPAGLAVEVDGVAGTAPRSLTWEPGTTHTIGAPSPQQIPTGRYAFVRWSDGGAQSHSIQTPSSEATYTAEFTPQYRLTASASPPAGGTISLSPPSLDGYYDSGTRVRLTVQANPGYRFFGWSGELAGGANPQYLTMTAERNVTAIFLATGPAITSVVDSASGRPTIAPNSFVTLYGANFSTWTGGWDGAIQNGLLPTTLGNVQVRINGKDCYVSYVQSNQLNVLTPLDTAAGSVAVEVITPQGTATSTALMAPVAPALFAYTLSGKSYAVAHLFQPGLPTIVGPDHPAHAGDYLTLWALGMGPTNPVAPSGRLLDTAYPITDLSRVKVKFGALDAPVLWAGLVMPGLFQVNVQTPPGLSGEQPVVVTVDGVSTQPGAFLPFQ